MEDASLAGHPPLNHMDDLTLWWVEELTDSPTQPLERNRRLDTAKQPEVEIEGWEIPELLDVSLMSP